MNAPKREDGRVVTTRRSLADLHAQARPLGDDVYYWLGRIERCAEMLLDYIDGTDSRPTPAPGDIVDITIKGAVISDRHSTAKRLWFEIDEKPYYLPAGSEFVTVEHTAPHVHTGALDHQLADALHTADIIRFTLDHDADAAHRYGVEASVGKAHVMAVRATPGEALTAAITALKAAAQVTR